MKKCSKCKETKAKTEFYRKRTSKDGLQDWCKKCMAEYQKSPRRKATQKRYDQSNKRKAARKRYAQSDAYKAKQKRYAQSTKGRMVQKQANRRMRETHPERIRAASAVNNAVAAGRLPHISAQKCHCGDPAVSYHHHSYEPEYWLDVDPLCRKCHSEAHS